ncbi:MAG TPA: hypothetical protein VIM11_28460 [Tepidisphaeraceae bacterium]
MAAFDGVALVNAVVTVGFKLLVVGTFTTGVATIVGVVTTIVAVTGAVVVTGVGVTVDVAAAGAITTGAATTATTPAEVVAEELDALDELLLPLPAGEALGVVAGASAAAAAPLAVALKFFCSSTASAMFTEAS